MSEVKSMQDNGAWTSDPKPIFVVGSGRSGTSILFRLLVGHPQNAWVSNLTNSYPQYPQLAILSRLPKKERFQRLMPDYEAINVYEYCGINTAFNQKGASLTEADVTETARKRLRAIVKSHMVWMGKPRFINKNTQNTMRIRYLREIFPDAKIIHIIRNGYAVANSLSNVSWWPDLHLWWLGQTPKQWAEAGGRPLELCAIHWRRQVQEILNHKEYLPRDQYLECRYEDLMDQPKQVLRKILTFCQLEWSPAYERYVDRVGLRKGNKDKWREAIDPVSEEAIRKAAGDLLEELGYEKNR